MKIFRMIIAGMLLIGIGICIEGCGAVGGIKPPTPEQIKATDHGIFPDNFKEVIAAYMDDILIDPESVRYTNWKGPIIGWAGDKLRGYFFGYGVCVEINARNKMGGYTGSKPAFFIIHNGEVQYHTGGFPRGSVGEDRVCKLCENVPDSEEIAVK